MYFFVNKGNSTLYKTTDIYEAKKFYYERVRNQRAVDSRRITLNVKFEQVLRTKTLRG